MDWLEHFKISFKSSLENWRLSISWDTCVWHSKTGSLQSPTFYSLASQLILLHIIQILAVWKDTGVTVRLRGGGWSGLYSNVCQGRVSKCGLLPSVLTFLPGSSSPLESLREEAIFFKMQTAPSMMSDNTVFTLVCKECLRHFLKQAPCSFL